MTYRKVIIDTMRMKPKYEKRSGSDCRVSKHGFRASEKLMDRPLERDEDDISNENACMAH